MPTCRNQGVSFSLESGGVASNWKIFRAYPWQSPRELAAPYGRGVEIWWVGQPGAVLTVDTPGGEAQLRHGSVLILRYLGYDLVLSRVRLLPLADRAGIASVHQSGIPIVVWAPGGGDISVAMEIARGLERTGTRLETRSGDIVLAGQPEVPCQNFGQFEARGGVKTPLWPWVIGALGLAAGVTALAVSAHRRSVTRQEEQWVMAGVRSTRRVSLYDGRRGTLVRTRGDVADVRWDDKPHKIRSAYLHDLRRAA